MEELFLSPEPKTPLLGDDGLVIEEIFGSWIDISTSSLLDQPRSSSGKIGMPFSFQNFVKYI